MAERQRLKVSGSTKPQDLAGAIAKFILQDRQQIEIIAIGAGANQQCTKAMILARRFVSSSGMNLAFIPAFETIIIDGKEITANKWLPVELS
jgi:stage V sporulation protein S